MTELQLPRGRERSEFDGTDWFVLPARQQGLPRATMRKQPASILTGLLIAWELLAPLTAVPVFSRR